MAQQHGAAPNPILRDQSAPNSMPSGTLIASISGIRGIFGDGLDPAVLVRYASAFGTWCRQRAEVAERRPVVVVGRDARTTGDLCAQLVRATLRATGCDVIDAGLATTPTVEMAVLAEDAAGGVVLSASHNPAEWNALKLLNEKGEFLAPDEARLVLQIAGDDAAEIVAHDAVGTEAAQDYLDHHVRQILDLDFIDVGAIQGERFRVVVDGINSVGAIALPRLLRALGVEPDNVVVLNAEPNGRFAHPAEPLPGHLTGLMEAVTAEDADLGLAVDPDADRLALVDDEGRYVSEELTQVIAADFLWGRRTGPFVTNLSSSRAIDDVAARHGEEVFRSKVGEINVVKRMQAVGAVLGGEGNGGVILPELHYGRDALAGTAMILQHLAETGHTLADVHDAMPSYAIVKDKLPRPDLDLELVFGELAQRYADEEISAEDGLKVSFAKSWVHLRPSNTEPIVRVYAEAETEAEARALVDEARAALEEATQAVR
jgi:phosphomannomutase